MLALAEAMNAEVLAVSRAGSFTMRLRTRRTPSRPWRIHEVTRDFRLEDVWALPDAGRPDDFPRLVDGMASGDPSQNVPPRHPHALGDPVEARRAARLGRPRRGAGLQGADAPRPVAGGSARRPNRPGFDALPFTSLYLLEDEWAAEIANRTMHGVLHIGWVPDGAGGYRGQMAVLVKPNGPLGTAYMAAIRPFRHLIVYPAMMQKIEREWRGAPAIRHRRNA